MSIQSYCFSLEGLSHREKNMPCQDNSGLLKRGPWQAAAVADGVGSCRYAEIASKIAVETACKVINAAFPYEGDENFLALMRIAMHSAENAIEAYILKNKGNINDYQTTLALALYNGKTLYFANAGDSGIIALDEYGQYHVLTQKQNNEYGDVHTLAERKFEVGKADFIPAAVACMTDGVLDWVVPRSLEKEKSKIHVPRASLFVHPDFWRRKTPLDETAMEEYRENAKAELEDIVLMAAESRNDHEVYGSLMEGNLMDDLSVAVMVNPSSLIDPASISWKPPAPPTADEYYLAQWRMLKRQYPSVAEYELVKKIFEANQTWTYQDVQKYVEFIKELDNEESASSGQDVDWSDDETEEPEEEFAEDGCDEDDEDEEEDEDVQVKPRKGLFGRKTREPSHSKRRK